MKLFQLPIEPIPMRYSEPWVEWFRSAFDKQGFEVTTVLGDKCAAPDAEHFLDPVGTWKWKFSQLARLVEAIGSLPREEEVAVFLHDAWMPGIECLGYLRDMDGRSIFVSGFLHAGAYDNTDLLARSGMGWVHGSEYTWCEMMDQVFVGTHYHSRKLPASAADKVQVVGIPVEAKTKLRREEREPIVVFPHRLSVDKQPWLFDELKEQFESRMTAEFVKTHELGLSKDDYYSLLGRAACTVSFATHENFGIATVEAMQMGCPTVVPDRLSYKELVQEDSRYRTNAEAANLVEYFLMTKGVVAARGEEYLPGTVCGDVAKILKETCQ